jgi:molybdate transport system substrate-binding protein
VGAVVVAAALASACEGSGGLTVRVLAASSLTEAFDAIADRFERAHPDVDVELSFAASSELAAQIDQGAPADVFASADAPEMELVVDRGDAAGAPVAFARNRLAIAVEPGNPEAITALADLARPGLVVASCAPQVPCGRYAADALEQAGVTLEPATRTENVRAARTLVELGEADAAIVYETDVHRESDVEGVPIPADENVVARYPIVRLDASDNPDGARAFVEFVTGRVGQRVLRSFGFRSP